jgi:hypothetical protein
MIPQRATPPQQELSLVTCLTYGIPKGGKSTFWSKAPDAIFLATEPGLNNIECFRWQHTNGDYVIRTWDDFKKAIEEVKAARQFKTVIIDTIDNAWIMCADKVCKNNKVEYQNDGALGYGKGSALIQNEMRRTLIDLCDSHFGVVLISHAALVETEGPTGTAKKWVPTLHEKCRQVILGMVDMILFCDLDVDEKQKQIRVLRTIPSRLYEAGDRTGRLPEKVLLNYDVFAAVFNSKKSTPPPQTNGVKTAAIISPTPANQSSSGLGVTEFRALANKACTRHGKELVQAAIKKITGGGIAQAKPEQYSALEKELTALVNTPA